MWSKPEQIIAAAVGLCVAERIATFVNLDHADEAEFWRSVRQDARRGKLPCLRQVEDLFAKVCSEMGIRDHGEYERIRLCLFSSPDGGGCRE